MTMRVCPLNNFNWKLFNAKQQQPRTNMQSFHLSATSSAMSKKDHRLAGRLFGPRDENGQWWDDKCMFYPVVLDPSSTGSLWRMYYYGRDQDSWHSGVSPALISSGRIGLAISEDGISWSRCPGPLPGGAIMDPVEANPLCFDCVHIGCSDLFLHNGEWWMFYFGGSLEETIFGPQMHTMKGIKMRVGLAKSSDGISFVRNEVPVLDLGDKGEWDELLVAWARVVPPKLHGSNKWLMTYCSIEKTSSAGCFAIGAAISDNGETWEKRGKVLERGAPGAWDDRGVGRHHVLYVNGQYIMFYEGVNSQGIHAIGVAFSTDGQVWRKSVEPWSQPGGPIFTSTDDKEAWDSGGISCPHVLKFKDEHYRLYYVGTNSSKELSCMGLAISEGLNIRSWKRIDPNVVNKRRPASLTL